MEGFVRFLLIDLSLFTGNHLEELQASCKHRMLWYANLAYSTCILFSFFTLIFICADGRK